LRVENFYDVLIYANASCAKGFNLEEFISCAGQPTIHSVANDSPSLQHLRKVVFLCREDGHR